MGLKFVYLSYVLEVIACRGTRCATRSICWWFELSLVWRQSQGVSCWALGAGSFATEDMDKFVTLFICSRF